MKTSELIKLLRKSGKCRLVRHGSRHDIWESDITGKTFTVPRHPNGDIPVGTANSILRDAGLK